MTSRNAPEHNQTLAQRFVEVAQRHADQVAYRHRDRDGGEADVTYGALYAEVCEFAAGLFALGLDGKTLITISDNCVELATTILASMGSGCVDVEKENVYPRQELQQIFDIVDPDFVCLENRASYDKFCALDTRRDLPLIVFDPRGITLPDRAMTRESVMRAGRAYLQEHGDVYRRTAAATDPDQQATVVFTSGTTGTPKGVMLSHRNLTFAVTEFGRHLQLRPGETYLSVIHIRHIGEKMAIFIALTHGYRVVLSGIPHLREDLLRYRPHILAGAPLLWKTFRDAILQKIDEAGDRGLFDFFFQRSLKYVRAMRLLTRTVAMSRPPSPWERAQAVSDALIQLPFHLAAKGLIYRKIVASTGGQVRVVVSGGAFLHAEVDDFFDVLGLRIVNGYGSNETTAVVTVRGLVDNVRHTIGKLAPQTRCQLVDPDTRAPVGRGEPGLLLVKGPQVFLGYLRNPEGTRAALSDDGWYTTGDLLRETIDGNYEFVGRIKDTISLLDRNNFEPEPIEQLLESSPYIKHAVVFGQDEQFLTALLVPCFDNLRARLKAPDTVPDAGLIRRDGIHELFSREVSSRINAAHGFQPHEEIRAFSLIPKPLEVGQHLTYTMKKRRGNIQATYQPLLDDLYASTRPAEVAF